MVTPNDFDHRLRIKTNTVTTNNWCQKCFVSMTTLRVCSETKIKAKLVTRQNFVYSFQSLKNLISKLKLNNQYRRKVLLRSFHLIDHRLETKKRFHLNSHATWFRPQTRNVDIIKINFGRKGWLSKAGKEILSDLTVILLVSHVFFYQNYLKAK